MKYFLVFIFLFVNSMNSYSQEEICEDTTRTSKLLGQLKKSGLNFKETVYDISESGWNTAGNGLRNVKDVTVDYSRDSLNFFSELTDSAHDKVIRSSKFVSQEFNDSRDFMSALGKKLKVDFKRPDIKFSQIEFEHDFDWPDLKLSKRIDGLTAALNEMAIDPQLGEYFKNIGIKSSVGLMDFAWEILTFRCGACNVLNSAQLFYSKTRMIFDGYKPRSDVYNLWGFLGSQKQDLNASDYWDYTGFVFKTVLKVYFKCGIPGVSFGDIAGMVDILENLSKLNPHGLALSAGQKAGQCLINGAIKNTMKGLGFSARDKKVVMEFNVENLYNVNHSEELTDMKNCFGKKMVCIGEYKTPNFKNVVYDLSKKYFKAYLDLRYNSFTDRLNPMNWGKRDKYFFN